MTIGTIIATLRKEHAMTQESLANALGVTNQAVSKWESDQSCPDISLLPTIADLFHISMDRLFGRNTSPAQEKPTLPWQNDDTIRIVVYQGHTYLKNYKKADEIHVHLNDITAQNVDCAVSLTIEGNVYLNASAGGNVTCNNVMGSVHAGGSVTCNDIAGNVDAGGSILCNDIAAAFNATDKTPE